MLAKSSYDPSIPLIEIGRKPMAEAFQDLAMENTMFLSRNALYHQMHLSLDADLGAFIHGHARGSQRAVAREYAYDIKDGSFSRQTHTDTFIELVEAYISMGGMRLPKLPPELEVKLKESKFYERLSHCVDTHAISPEAAGTASFMILEEIFGPGIYAESLKGNFARVMAVGSDPATRQLSEANPLIKEWGAFGPYSKPN